MKTIEELKNGQKETLEYNKLNSERFKRELIKEKSLEELGSELFTGKFYFQVHLKQQIKGDYWLLMYLDLPLTFTCLNMISIHNLILKF